MTPLIDNPRYPAEHWRYGKAVLERERWTYWHDLRRTYGVDEHGFARRTWGNAGVQYGLVALRKEKISPEVFLHLNANVGSWQPPHRQQPPRFWLLSGPLSEHGGLRDLSIWSAHNMQTNDRREAGRPEDFAPDSTTAVPVAPRRHADPEAVRAAWRSGQVFLGAIDVPVLDVRHYLDPELDMHHSFASLAARARLDNAGRQVIWVAQPGWNFLPDALTVMERWLTHGRPPGAEDACFRDDGGVIARGPDVWDGPWNGRPAGACHERFPPFASPRTMAGEPVAGDVLSCRRVPVADFLAQGGYGPVDMAPYLHHLQRVFADGVCDYRDGPGVADSILR